MADTCDLLCLDMPKAEAMREALPRVEDLEASAARFKALGDPTRLAIALALAHGGRACVSDLGWVVGRAAISARERQDPMCRRRGLLLATAL